MHSGVFEVAHTPVPAFQRARAGNLPDWFYEQVCDYAENPSSIQREQAIRQLFSCLGSSCTPSGSGFAISPQIRGKHFRKSYSYFKAAAKALAQSEYDVFAESNSALRLALDGLNDSYEDKRGIYIYLAESGKLVTLDHWIRTADFSKPFYIGGAVNCRYKF